MTTNKVELDFSGERVVPGKTPYAMLQQHVGRYVFASGFVKGNCSVLDVACGVGYGTAYLAKNGGKVIGGDIDRVSVTYAYQLYPGEDKSYVALDCLHLPFANRSFDIVVSIETIEHLINYDGFIKECRRVVKDNGLFICTTPNGEVFHPWGIGFKGYHVHEFSPDELRKLLGKYWANVTLYGQCPTSRREMVASLFTDCFFGIGERCLSILPRGTKVKGFIRSFINRRFRNFPAWSEISDDMLDKKYAFYPLNSSLSTFLGAVATNSVILNSEEEYSIQTR